MLDHTDFDACYAAVRSRDRRFDGRVVTGVLTTGIYCRPSCPARTPLPRNVRFFPSAAAAQAAGLRACRRCRPELAPDAPDVDPTTALAARVLRLIRSGAGADGVEALAAAAHVSPRHLQRITTAAYGVPPAALLRMHRVRLARLLVDQTDLPLARVAFAAGFGSVRQFNEAFRAAFHVAPSALRRARGSSAHASSARASTTAGRGTSPDVPELTVTLPVRTPFDAAGVLRWAALHAVPSRDELDPDQSSWTRDEGDLRVRLRPVAGDDPARPGQAGLEVTLLDAPADGPPAEDGLERAVALARQAFDLDADVDAVHDALADDPLLADAVAARPGVRLPGSPNPLEGAIRVVLGQQVSSRGATTLMTRLADLHDGPGLPPAEVIAGLPLESAIGLTRQRAGAVRALAAAAADGLELGPGADAAETVRALEALPGIGPWTAGCVALLVLRHPDAWPTGDLALRRIVEAKTGTATTAADLDRLAERWRPWRGYAALWLWHAYLDG